MASRVLDRRRRYGASHKKSLPDFPNKPYNPYILEFNEFVVSRTDLAGAIQYDQQRSEIASLSVDALIATNPNLVRDARISQPACAGFPASPKAGAPRMGAAQSRGKVPDAVHVFHAWTAAKIKNGVPASPIADFVLGDCCGARPYKLAPRK